MTKDNILRMLVRAFISSGLFEAVEQYVKDPNYRPSVTEDNVREAEEWNYSWGGTLARLKWEYKGLVGEGLRAAIDALSLALKLWPNEPEAMARFLEVVVGEDVIKNVTSLLPLGDGLLPGAVEAALRYLQE